MFRLFMKNLHKKGVQFVKKTLLCNVFAFFCCRLSDSTEGTARHRIVYCDYIADNRKLRFKCECGIFKTHGVWE